MAETEGFEPSIRLTAYDDLANRCLQPLGHVSMLHLGSEGSLPRFGGGCKPVVSFPVLNKILVYLANNWFMGLGLEFENA
jgi:hypothetical protein